MICAISQKEKDRKGSLRLLLWLPAAQTKEKPMMDVNPQLPTRKAKPPRSLKDWFACSYFAFAAIGLIRLKRLPGAGAPSPTAPLKYAANPRFSMGFIDFFNWTSPSRSVRFSE
jgi:hypothetical protein